MYLRNENGFTLAELIVGIIVVSIFMLGTFIFQHNMLAFSRQGTARVELQRQGTLALEYMIRSIRGAADVDIGNWEGGVDNGIMVTTLDGIFSYGSEEDNLYMYLGDLGDDDRELLIGDYTQGGFGIRLASLTFADNYDGLDPITNTVDVDLNLKLVDLSTDPAITLETMNFGAQVQPRNRG